MNEQDREFLTHLFDAAVAAADPLAALDGALPSKPVGRTVVVGAGKGAAQLGAAFESLWDEPFEGVVVTRYGYSAPCKFLKVIEAAHPVPDEAGLAASQALMQAVAGLEPGDLVIALICGGGSALLPSPPNGLSLHDEQALNQALLASGAPISVMNCIRKQVSGIKGGRLARAAHPARVVSLVVSDVPGDDPAQVASGPTVADARTRVDALADVEAYKIKLPKRVVQFLQSSPEDAPLPDDPAFAGDQVRVIASASLSLEAAARTSEKLGVSAVILSDAIEGEAREVGKVHAALAKEIVLRNRPFPRPVVLLSGGETTVTLKNTDGKGGRNAEFALSLALALDGVDGVAALAADTDGIDGTETNAGAFCDGSTAQQLRGAGLDPAGLLADHKSWTAFNAIDSLFSPGPTGTNVNDFRAILIR